MMLSALIRIASSCLEPGQSKTKQRNLRTTKLSHNLSNVPSDMCASAQFGQRLRGPHEETLRPWLSKNAPSEDPGETPRMHRLI